MNKQDRIPQGDYCYTLIDDTITICPYYSLIQKTLLYETKTIQCEYLGIIDSFEDTLLWDMVKECGVNDDYFE